jgi:hypothetical protein
MSGPARYRRRYFGVLGRLLTEDFRCDRLRPKMAGHRRSAASAERPVSVYSSPS